MTTVPPQTPLTATDLQRFLSCPHAFHLSLSSAAPGGTMSARPLTAKDLQNPGDDIPGGILRSDRWQARADRLLRSADGTRREPLLQSGAEPETGAVLNLALFALLLAPLQGGVPEQIWLREGDAPPRPLRTEEVLHYTRAACTRLDAALAADTAPRPQPCRACPACPHLAQCRATWQAEESLHSLPGMTRTTLRALEAAGIHSPAALLQNREAPPPGLSETGFARLQAEARVQQAAQDGRPAWELRPHEPGRGFDLLPAPAETDLFYRFEGEIRGAHSHELRDSQGTLRVSTPGDGSAAEVFRALLERLRAALEAAPASRLWHYGSGDASALKRLAALSGTGEALIDRLLRGDRLVDLAQILRGALVTPGPEALVPELPRGEAPGADLLPRLRDRLTGLRPDAPVPEPDPPAPGPDEKEQAAEAELAAFIATLEAADLSAERRELLLNLGLFHSRELKPAQWAVFDSLSQETSRLMEDAEALGGLVATGPAEPVKRSFLRAYRFPPQESRLRAGKRATIAVPGRPPASVTIESLDRRTGRLELKAGPGKAALLRDRLDLHPDWPLDTGVIATALRDVIDDHCGAQRYRAICDLLDRSPPRLSGGPLRPAADPTAALIAAVAQMEETVLPVQGPPGTGKTYSTARAIRGLLAQGARIGVASNSHEAIRNLLSGCLNALEEDPLPFTPEVIHKTSGGGEGEEADPRIRCTARNEEAAAGRHLVGGTAWFFCREENIQAFDWLIVDEAGQVGLATLAAMARAARNLVLVGDPLQLPQVIQGSHPGAAALSCLEYLAGDSGRIAPDRGIFLPVSRRMHPQICGYVSDQFYGGALQSHPPAAAQRITGSRFPEAGVFWCPVPHEGNLQTAEEEAAAIAAAVQDLLRGAWQAHGTPARPLRPQDIIVVAPYNAQVSLLRERLPPGLRVGTVDKFQGQEAPVCLVSMTGSEAAGSARGMEFLLSRHRLNVAVSRAKALALVFGAPALREAPCEGLSQIRLVNALCALPELPGAG